MSKDKADVATPEYIVGVAALHVEEDTIYYTCKDKVSSQYMLKKGVLMRLEHFMIASQDFFTYVELQKIKMVIIML